MNRYLSPRYRQQAGFTLLELLVVLMIIALLAGFVAPRLFAQAEGAKEKTALSQMKTLSEALGQYRLDVGQYPSEAQGLKALTERPSGIQNWHGPYLSKALPLDPWGNAYQWQNPTRSKNVVYEVELLTTSQDGRSLSYGF